MSALETMQVFARVAELASFTQAADSLGMTKASVSIAVQQLEGRLGVRLLHRTTRKVTLTQDGMAFYERCKDLLADADELQTMFQQAAGVQLRGRVRVDMSTAMARHAVIPRLPELLAQHPLLELEISSTERRVDLVREGFDCVLRAGPVAESGLVARAVGQMDMCNCASPGYLQRAGRPEHPDDLARHQLIHYANTLGAKPDGFEFVRQGQLHRQAMAGAITVNNAEAYAAACVAGLGLIQVPRVGVLELLHRETLVEIMPAYIAPPMPLTLVYAHRRNLSVRVRVVMDWLVAVAAEHVRSGALPPKPARYQ